MSHEAASVTRVFLGVAVLLLAARQASAGDRYFVSVREPGLANSDRVVAFTLRVVGGWVDSIPRIPFDWSLHLDNSPNWQCTLGGAAGHGIGALTAQQGFFRRFVIVQRLGAVQGVPLPALKLELEMQVFRMPDPSDVRTIRLDMNDLLLESATSPEVGAVGGLVRHSGALVPRAVELVDRQPGTE